uniref:Zinc finger Sec23/Sec24-type domain-containing protein n=1 Tax=Ananas comosus var. bracteatus TaxID=296719 RepID=A0A6V7PL58_ANACO|nr:unnamed protein product [Ananas comosus var. bracteatus]
MASAPPGPQRPRPPFIPNPNTNTNPNPNPSSLPDSFQNLQIGRPPPPSAVPRGVAPLSPFPLPPPSRRLPRRPRPRAFRRRRPADGPARVDQGPLPSAAPPQSHVVRPFPGSPPAGPFTGNPALAGPPNSQPYMAPPSSQPFFGTPSSQPFRGPPSSQPFSRLPSSQPFMGPQPPFSGPPASTAPFGAPAWQPQPRPGAFPGSVPPPVRMPGIPLNAQNQMMPPPPPAMGYSPHAGTQMSTPLKIDPNQIPRPMPTSSVVVFETRQGNQANAANVPPPATSDFVVKDTGNCSPRLMRCTMNHIPCTGDLLSTSSMPLALMVQPFALPHPSEEPIQLVDFGETGPIRCSRCKAYINPFMRFIDQGRRFVCNLCGK